MVRRKSARARLCPICNQPMRKKGFTSAGRQRWKCDACNSSTTVRREDRTRLMQFHAFLDWVSGRLTAAQAGERLGVSARTFHRATAWCWNVRPGSDPTASCTGSCRPTAPSRSTAGACSSPSTSAAGSSHGSGAATRTGTPTDCILSSWVVRRGVVHKSWTALSLFLIMHHPRVSSGFSAWSAVLPLRAGFWVIWS